MDPGLFREEALRRWRDGGTKGEVLRLAPGWTTWASSLLVIALVVAVVGAFYVTVPVSVQGPATVIEEDRVLVLLPAGHASTLKPFTTLVFRGDRDGETVPLRIERVEPRVVGPAEARDLASPSSLHGRVPDAALVVWARSAGGFWVNEDGRSAAPPHPGETGTVTLTLGRRPLRDLLLPAKR